MTFAIIATAISWCGFIAFFIIRRRKRQPISRIGWFGLIVLFVMQGAIISQCQYMFLDEPLVNAAQDGDLTTAKSLLAHGASANAYGDDGRGTALVAAASAGHADVVKLLIQNGANVNRKSENFVTNLGNATPLQAASAYPEIVRLLKQAGAKG